MKNLWLIMAFLFIMVFSAIYPREVSAGFDEDGQSIVLSGDALLDSSKRPAELKEGSTALVKALVESGKYNVTLLDRGYQSAMEYKNIQNELASVLDDSSKLYVYESLSNSEKDSFRRGGRRSYFFPTSKTQTARELFASIVKKEMDDDETRVFADRGQNINLGGLEDVLLDLGAIALKDGFTPGDLNYSFDHSKKPAICRISVGAQAYPIDLALCVKNIEMEHRWLDEKARKCGHFDKSQNKLYQEVAALLCEPQHIQDFENYFQAKLLSTCAAAQNCLSGVSGASLQQLSQDFLAIMVESKVQGLRGKAYADADFEYRVDFDSLLDEVAAFGLICEKLGIDAMVLAKLNREETSLYEARVQEINTAFTEALSRLVSSEDLDQLRDNGSYYHKKCVLIKKEQGEVSQSNDGFFESCEKEALSKTLNEVVSLLAKEKDGSRAQIEEFVKDSLSLDCSFFGRKPPKIEGYRSARKRDGDSLASFDYQYDMKRCTQGISDLTRNYEAYGDLDESTLASFRTDLGSGLEPNRLQSLLRGNVQDCLEGLSGQDKEDSVKISQCREEGLVTTRAQAFIESISLSARGSTPVRRDEGVLSDVLTLAQSNDDIKKCLYEEASAVELRNCSEFIKSAIVENIPTGLFSGDSGGAATALHADLELMTKTLSREISVFHWADDSLTGNDVSEPVSLTSWSAYKYAVSREYMFHVGPFIDGMISSAGATMAGRGLYAASDPNSTASYGNTLFEIRIPEGSRFLDLREGGSDGSIPITKDTYDKMIAEGCDFSSNKRGGVISSEISPASATRLIRQGGDGFYAMISKTLFEQNSACHSIFSEAISRLDANFLAYSYGSSPANFCDKASSFDSAAFVMIDNRMRGNVRSYNRAQIDSAIKEHEEKGTPIPDDIRRVLQLNNGLYSASNTDYLEQTDSEAVNHWKSRLFSCDQSIPEDQLSRGLR